RILRAFVAARDAETLLDWERAQVFRRVPHPDAEIETACSFFRQRDRRRPLHAGECRERNRNLLPVVRATAVGVLAGERASEPGARDEVGGRLFESLKVAVEPEQNENVFLRVEPAAPLAIGEKPRDDL